MPLSTERFPPAPQDDKAEFARRKRESDPPDQNPIANSGITFPGVGGTSEQGPPSAGSTRPPQQLPRFETSPPEFYDPITYPPPGAAIPLPPVPAGLQLPNQPFLGGSRTEYQTNGAVQDFPFQQFRDKPEVSPWEQVTMPPKETLRDMFTKAKLLEGGLRQLLNNFFDAAPVATFIDRVEEKESPASIARALYVSGVTDPKLLENILKVISAIIDTAPSQQNWVTGKAFIAAVKAALASRT